MPTITNTIDIKASPDHVWAVLTDFVGTHKWCPGVIAARIDGAMRVCTMADGQEIHEQISDIRPAAGIVAPLRFVEDGITQGS